MQSRGGNAYRHKRRQMVLSEDFLPENLPPQKYWHEHKDWHDRLSGWLLEHRGAKYSAYFLKVMVGADDVTTATVERYCRELRWTRKGGTEFPVDCDHHPDFEGVRCYGID